MEPDNGDGVKPSYMVPPTANIPVNVRVLFPLLLTVNVLAIVVLMLAFPKARSPVTLMIRVGVTVTVGVGVGVGVVAVSFLPHAEKRTSRTSGRTRRMVTGSRVCWGAVKGG